MIATGGFISIVLAISAQTSPTCRDFTLYYDKDEANISGEALNVVAEAMAFASSKSVPKGIQVHGHRDFLEYQLISGDRSTLIRNFLDTALPAAWQVSASDRGVSQPAGARREYGEPLTRRVVIQVCG